MTSLVAYGSDSEQSSGEDEDFFGKEAPEEGESNATEKSKTKEVDSKPEEAGPALTSFFFSGDDDNDGEESSDSDEEGESSVPKKKRKAGESVTELNREFVSWEKWKS